MYAALYTSVWHVYYLFSMPSRMGLRIILQAYMSVKYIPRY